MPRVVSNDIYASLTKGQRLLLELDWPDADRLEIAWAVAPTLKVLRALIAGESVPVEVLDMEQLNRFGRRP